MVKFDSFFKHKAWFMNKKLSLDMEETLKMVRVRCWNGHLLAIPGPRLYRALSSILLEFDQSINEIDQLLKAAKFKDPNLFRPWDTLMILAGFLKMYHIEPNRHVSEHIGLPYMTEDVQRMRVTSSQYQEMWQQILDTLSGGLVKYSSLVEVLCGGEQTQVCYGCSRKVNVSEVIRTEQLTGTEVVEDEKPFLMFGLVRASFCGKAVCSNRRKEILVTYVKFGMLYARMFCESILYTCGYCAMPGGGGSKGHRCSKCLTKVYCGDECRNKDWGVHKLVCKEGEVKRKRKGGQQERKNDGMDWYVKEMFESMSMSRRKH